MDAAREKLNVIIPKFPTFPTNLSFTFKILSFSLRLSFAMSINKSLDQTLKVAGFNWKNSASFMDSSFWDVHVLEQSLYECSRSKKRNIVYSEVHSSSCFEPCISVKNDIYHKTV